MKTQIRAAVFLALSLLLNSGGDAATFRVEMVSGHEYSPSYLEIQMGDTVEFVNTTGVKHTVTADPLLVDNPTDVILPEGALTFDSGKLDKEQSFSHTFDLPGLYQYVCLPHQRHMKGQIMVLPPVPVTEE